MSAKSNTTARLSSAAGWVCLHRQLMDNPVFGNSTLLHLWIYCLLKASHKPHKAIVGKQIVELEAGQFIYGRKKAAAETGIKEGTIYDNMRVLESLEMIRINANNKYSVVTVENWGLYQDEGEDVQQQTNNKPTTSQQQTNTYNNGNNGNNGNKRARARNQEEKLAELYAAYGVRVGG